MKRPWNIINVPVYSLATYSNSQVNMNICTYVTGISNDPRLFAIAIDPKSKTFSNLKKSKNVVLQLLHKDQINQVKQLGKKSGYNFDKQSYLINRKLLTLWNGYTVLKNSSALLLLKQIKSNRTGDHSLFQFQLLKSKAFDDKNILMFQDLIEQNIIL